MTAIKAASSGHPGESLKAVIANQATLQQLLPSRS
jgi:hypothetical protein